MWGFSGESRSVTWCVHRHLPKYLFLVWPKCAQNFTGTPFPQPSKAEDPSGGHFLYPGRKDDVFVSSAPACSLLLCGKRASAPTRSPQVAAECHGDMNVGVSVPFKHACWGVWEATSSLRSPFTPHLIFTTLKVPISKREKKIILRHSSQKAGVH